MPGGTRLCATIRDDSLEAIQAANRSADLIEFRLDLFTPRDFHALRNACQKPVIFKLLEFDPKILHFSPDYIDLPFGIGHDLKLPVPRICSYHDEEQTPDLFALYEEMQQCPADYYKIATLARSSCDALRMLQLVRETKCIGLCMGELGAITRIVAPVVGTPWIYAPATSDQMTTTGQLLLTELLETYNFRSLTSRSGLYGLIGDPLEKSQGHIIHNQSFKKLRIDAVYVKMPVKKEELREFLPLCQKLGFQGLSVTMPLKELICEGEAINTIAFRDGKMECWNTDGVGALDALEKKIKVSGKKIVILGAGGAAQAIAEEAKKRGAEVVIANRTLERAKKWADRVVPLDRFASEGYDIMINCTPTCPIQVEELLENRVVMDIISHPKMTPLLEGADLKGCTLIYGIEMWLEQARGQYFHWFGLT